MIASSTSARLGRRPTVPYGARAGQAGSRSSSRWRRAGQSQPPVPPSRTTWCARWCGTAGSTRRASPPRCARRGRPIRRSVYDANCQDERGVPSLVQRELVEGGLLGRKSGRGFYDHHEGAVLPKLPAFEAAQAPEAGRVGALPRRALSRQPGAAAGVAGGLKLPRHDTVWLLTPVGLARRNRQQTRASGRERSRAGLPGS